MSSIPDGFEPAYGFELIERRLRIATSEGLSLSEDEAVYDIGYVELLLAAKAIGLPVDEEQINTEAALVNLSVYPVSQQITVDYCYVKITGDLLQAIFGYDMADVPTRITYSGKFLVEWPE